MKEGYKKTELGWIPEEWEVRPLQEIGEFKNGINKGKEDFGFGHPFVNLSDVFGNLVVNTKKLGLVNSTAKERNDYDLQAGDVLFVRSSVKPSGVGLTAVVDEKLIDAVYSGFLIRFRDRGALINEYKKHCFSEDGFRKRLLNSSTISANTNINQQALNSLLLPIPPFPEQQKIAEILSTVDEKIAVIDEQITQSSKLKKALMQRLLTKGIGHTRFKDSPLGTIPFGWEVVKLGEAIEKIVGGGTPARDISEYWGGTIPWATVKDLKATVLGSTQEFINEQGLVNSSANLIPAFTLIAATRMALGKAVFFKCDVAINQDLKAIFPKPSLSKFFLFHWFEYNSLRIEGMGSGSTVKGIRLEVLKALIIALPSVHEQQQIAEILTTVDDKLQVLQDKKQHYQELKNGLMQQLLTGKLRVNHQFQTAVPA